MANRKMNLGDVKVGTCYFSTLRGAVVSIIRVAYTHREKLAMFGDKYKKAGRSDMPMWDAVSKPGGPKGDKKIAADASDLSALEFVPKTDSRWFDPTTVSPASVLKTNVASIDKGVRDIAKVLALLKKADVYGTSTLTRDLKQFTSNLDAICKHVGV